MSKKEIYHAAGKRKMALARTSIRPGKGNIRINSIPLEIYGDNMERLRIKEPLMLAKGLVDVDKLDFIIKSSGGGRSGQVDAIRSSIAKALLEYAAKSKKDAQLREKFVEYDRSMVSGDSRRTEPHKPSKSSSGPRAKRQKSYR
jgi:small subunit ribosomal protein S9